MTLPLNMVCHYKGALTKGEIEQKRTQRIAGGIQQSLTGEVDPAARDFSCTRNLLTKIESARNLITTALSNQTNPVISFSGGKDSLVVLHLVRSIKPDVPALFSNTGNEYPETLEYVSTIPNVIELTPEMTIVNKDKVKETIRGNRVFWECVKKYGLPTNKSKSKRHGNQCCNYLKEKPLRTWQMEHNVDLIFDGLTSAESRQRMLTLKRVSPYYLNKQDGAYRCRPIHDWTEVEVWAYIDIKQLDFNPIYVDDPTTGRKAVPRCGCRFCTAYKSSVRVMERYNPKDNIVIAGKRNIKVLNKF